MIKKRIKQNTGFIINNSVTGETIEQKMNRVTANKEPIDDSAPIIYQERKEGVNPAFDIRTDRWEVALEAMDAVHKSNIAKRNHATKEKEAAEAASTQATNGDESQ